MSADAAIRILRFALGTISRFHRETISGHLSFFSQECRTLLGDCRKEHSMSVFGLVNSEGGVLNVSSGLTVRENLASYLQ
jgi:hypothetical protein